MTNPIDDASELRAWLKENREMLAKYDSDELASMAHVCLSWIRWETIYSVLSHISDAKCGSSIDRRADMQINLEVSAIDRQSGKINLSQQWRELHDYLETGKEFR